MLRGVVLPVFRDQGRGLREQRDGEQQQDKEQPPVAVNLARYVARNRHTISFKYVYLSP